MTVIQSDFIEVIRGANFTHTSKAQVARSAHNGTKNKVLGASLFQSNLHFMRCRRTPPIWRTVQLTFTPTQTQRRLGVRRPSTYCFMVPFLLRSLVSGDVIVLHLISVCWFWVKLLEFEFEKSNLFTQIAVLFFQTKTGC